VRERVIGQNAFDPRDASSSVAKTHALASLATRLHTAGRAALDAGTQLENIDLSGARAAITAARDSTSDALAANIAAADRTIDALAGERESSP